MGRFAREGGIQPVQQAVDLLDLVELASAPCNFFHVGKIPVQGTGPVVVEKQRALDQKPADDPQPGFAPKGQGQAAAGKPALVNPGLGRLLECDGFTVTQPKKPLKMVAAQTPGGGRDIRRAGRRFPGLQFLQSQMEKAAGFGYDGGQIAPAFDFLPIGDNDTVAKGRQFFLQGLPLFRGRQCCQGTCEKVADGQHGRGNQGIEIRMVRSDGFLPEGPAPENVFAPGLIKSHGFLKRQKPLFGKARGAQAVLFLLGFGRQHVNRFEQNGLEADIVAFR